MAHDKVYVRIAEDDNFGTASIEQRLFTEAYIRKDALLEYIKKELSENQDWRETNPYDRFFGGIEVAYNRVIDKINSL